MNPSVGRQLYVKVRQELGKSSDLGNMRGEEMMEGEELEALERAVWDDEVFENEETTEGLEAELESGDGLYIPLGWWHAVRGVGTGANASVSVP